MRSVALIGSHGTASFLRSVLQFSSGVVKHGFDVKSCCGLPGLEREKNSVVYARSSRDSCRAEPDYGPGYQACGRPLRGGK